MTYAVSLDWVLCYVTKMCVMLCPAPMPYAISLDCMLTYATLLSDIFVTELFPFMCSQMTANTNIFDDMCRL